MYGFFLNFRFDIAFEVSYKQPPLSILIIPKSKLEDPKIKEK